MKMKELTALNQHSEYLNVDPADTEELEHSLDSDIEEYEEKTQNNAKNVKGEQSGTPDPNYRLLGAYFKDLSTEGLLKRRDEAVLASKIKLCNEKLENIQKLLDSSRSSKRSEAQTAKLLALKNLYNSKYTEARDKFIKSNLRLVIELANRYLGKGLALGDLIQEGNIGLMKAVVKFDHTKGFKFSTYAAWWIHQSLARATMEQTNVISIPVYLQEMTSKVYKAKNRLEHNSDIKALPEQIAKEAKVSVDSVKTILNGRDLVVPIDVGSDEGDSKSYLDFTPDPNAKRSEFYLSLRAIKKEIRRSLSVLNERERDVLKMRFGIDYEDGHKLDQIATKYGLSRERIRQIESEALRKLADSEKGYILKGLLN